MIPDPSLVARNREMDRVAFAPVFVRNIVREQSVNVRSAVGDVVPFTHRTVLVCSDRCFVLCRLTLRVDGVAERDYHENCKPKFHGGRLYPAIQVAVSRS